MKTKADRAAERLEGDFDEYTVVPQYVVVRSSELLALLKGYAALRTATISKKKTITSTRDKNGKIEIHKNGRIIGRQG